MLLALIFLPVSGKQRANSLKFADSLDGTGNPMPNIVGGEQLSQDEFPFLVRIDHPNGRCTGSLIAPLWVLTAGHCTVTRLSWINLPDVNMPFGTFTISLGTESQTVNRNAVAHPEFQAVVSGRSNDIALIELDRPFTSGIPVEIMSPHRRRQDPITGTTAIMAGWGYISDGIYPSSIHSAEVPVVECSQIQTESYELCLNVTDNWTSAGPGNPAPAPGDSGGPVVVRMGESYTLVGIIKGNRKFIDAGPYYDWIMQHVPAIPMADPVSDSGARRFHVLPHIADGNGWQSTLLVANTSQQASQCEMELHGKLDFNRLRNTSAAATIPGLTIGTDSATFELPENGGYLVWRTQNGSGIQTSYATLNCSESVTAKVVYAWFGSGVGSLHIDDLIAQGGQPLALATVFSSQAGSTFQFPMLMPQGNLGFAIANDADSEASCNMIVEDPQRVTIGERPLNVQPKTPTSRWVSQGVAIPEGFSGGTATFSCDHPVYMMGLHFELGTDGSVITFTTLPPDILE